MDELLCDKLWPRIRQLARTGTRRAAVAYVTSDEIIEFSQGDVLVTDASDHAIAAGLTSARVLQSAFRRKAKLYSLAGLHAKVMVLGDTAVIGSANLSNSSMNNLVEAAWVTNASAAVGKALAFIDQLVRAAEPIDAEFIKRIISIPAKASTIHAPRVMPAIMLPKHRFWIASVREMIRQPETESSAIDTGTATARKKLTNAASEPSWMRFTNKSLFRREASVGDTVIRIWTHAGDEHPFVYRHAPIVHRQDEDNCTRFFVEDFPDCEDTRLSMTEFTRLLKRAGFTGEIGRGSTRQLPDHLASILEHLWS